MCVCMCSDFYTSYKYVRHIQMNIYISVLHKSFNSFVHSSIVKCINNVLQCGCRMLQLGVYATFYLCSKLCILLLLLLLLLHFDTNVDISHMEQMDSTAILHII